METNRDLQGQGVKRVWVRGRKAYALEGTNVVPVITVLRVVEVESPPCVGEGNVSFNAKSCVHCSVQTRCGYGPMGTVLGTDLTALCRCVPPANGVGLPGAGAGPGPVDESSESLPDQDRA